jgi:hypothetical protein
VLVDPSWFYTNIHIFKSLKTIKMNLIMFNSCPITNVNVDTITAIGDRYYVLEYTEKE